MPGLGQRSIDKLNDYGIKSTAQLMGEYLKMDCDHDKFITYLTKAGISGQLAQIVEDALNAKARATMDGVPGADAN